MSLEESNELCLQRVNGKYLKQEGLQSHLSFTANWTKETRFKLAVSTLLLTSVSWGSISIVYIAQDTIVLQVREGIPVCFSGGGGGFPFLSTSERQLCCPVTASSEWRYHRGLTLRGVHYRRSEQLWAQFTVWGILLRLVNGSDGEVAGPCWSTDLPSATNPDYLLRSSCRPN